MEFSITEENKRESLFSTIIVAIIHIIGTIFFLLINIYDGALMFFFFLLPINAYNWYMYIHYLKYDNGKTLKVDSKKEEMVMIKGREIIWEMKFDEIEIITIHRSNKEGTVAISLINAHYYFLRIRTKEKNTYNLTCLIVGEKDLDFFRDNFDFKFKRSLPPIISKNV